VNPRRVLYRDAALLDTAAVFALFDERDAFHVDATQFFQTNQTTLVWFAVDTTALLRYMHKKYGSNVVWRMPVRGGPSNGLTSLVASEASLRVISVERAGRNLVFRNEVATLVPELASLQKPRSIGGDRVVMEEELQSEISKIWRALQKMGYVDR
jgi:hypothetical protein